MNNLWIYRFILYISSKLSISFLLSEKLTFFFFFFKYEFDFNNA